MDTHSHEFAATESLLAFWRDAGVDSCYVDAPIDHTKIAPPPPVQAVAKVTALHAMPTGQHGLANPAAAIAEAQRLAAASATLQDLAAAVANFEGCPLRGMGATQSVFGAGNAKAQVLVIGEAPGPEEDRMGQPFVGPAGQLLHKMLAAAGLTDKVFLTNSVFWAPPGNRPPSAEEQASCYPFLERAFTLLKPRAVLLLGASAARSVLNSEEAILRLRGTWKDWHPAGADAGTPALATLHPNFLLQHPQTKRMAWADLLALTERLESDSIAGEA